MLVAAQVGEIHCIEDLDETIERPGDQSGGFLVQIQVHDHLQALQAEGMDKQYTAYTHTVPSVMYWHLGWIPGACGKGIGKAELVIVLLNKGNKWIPSISRNHSPTTSVQFSSTKLPQLYPSGGALEWASSISCSAFPVIARSQTFTAVPPPEANRAPEGKAQPHSTGEPWLTWSQTVWSQKHGANLGKIWETLITFWRFLYEMLI